MRRPSGNGIFFKWLEKQTMLLESVVHRCQTKRHSVEFQQVPHYCTLGKRFSSHLTKTFPEFFSRMVRIPGRVENASVHLTVRFLKRS